MLKLAIPELDMFDDNTQRFISRKAKTLKLEHSLLSISKWESKYEKPFLTEEQKTEEEFRYYVMCMDITGTLTEEDTKMLLINEINEIQKYISQQHTATTFSGKDPNAKHSREVITSELVYYWLVSMEIPFEAEKWNINRLLTLIRICGIKNNPKKMSKRDTMINNTSLNAMRRKALGTKG